MPDESFRPPYPHDSPIPRILHQTWRSIEIPEQWRIYQESWRKHNPEWELMFWTDAKSREFIAAHYPWFLATWDGYREPIMRADAIRYFLLNHYGGVYADMDYECLKPFDDLLRGRTLVIGREPQHHPRPSEMEWMLCNALMCSVPGHPFWDHVFGYLMNARYLRGPLEATGPVLLTRAYKSFAAPESVCVLDSEALSPLTQPEAQCGRWNDPAFRAQVSRQSWAVHHWNNTWVRKEEFFYPLSNCRLHLLKQRRIVFAGELRTDVLEDIEDVLSGPPISCIMITRGRAALAARSLHAFRSQTYRNRELVILDDGEGEELEALAASHRDPAIRYIRVESRGLSLGLLRNRAVAEARGEYVAQWDDDDLSHPRRLELQFAAIRNLSADACFLLRELIWWPRDRRLAIGRTRVWESTMLCRKDTLPAYPDQRVGEDTPVVARLMRERRLALLDAAQLYVYVRHGANSFGEGHFERQWALADRQFSAAQYEEVIAAHDDELRFSDYPVQPDATPVLPDPVRAHHPAKGAGGDTFHDRKVLILTPVKNAAACLPLYFDNLRKIDHPHKNISLGFLESDSSDGSYDLLRSESARLSGDFRRVSVFQRHFHFHPGGFRWNPALQRERRSVLARSRNELLMRTLDDEDWVLWIDADVSEYPPDILARLFRCGKQIVTPDSAHEYGGTSFDLNTFQRGEEPVSFHESVHVAGTMAPRGEGRRYLSELREHEIVPVDSVGGVMLLVDASLHRDGLIFPSFPYKDSLETEGLAAMAKDMGVQAWGLPRLQVLHP